MCVAENYSEDEGGLASARGFIYVRAPSQ